MFLLTTLTGCILAPLILLANILVFKLDTGYLVRRGIQIYGWIIVRVIPFMAPVTIEDRSGGLETPAIFVPNHNSSVDPYLFGMLPLDNSFVTSWPFRIPLYNFFMKHAGYINSTRGWHHVHEQGCHLIAKGCSLIIWPEGHRSRTGKLGRFKNGAFRLALATGRPVVPVCIIGSHQILPPGSRLLNPARIRMVILPPIKTSGLEPSPETIQMIREQTHQEISEELASNNHSLSSEEIKVFCAPIKDQSINTFQQNGLV